MADPLLQADASKDNLIEQIQDLQERMDELERFALTSKNILASKIGIGDIDLDDIDPGDIATVPWTDYSALSTVWGWSAFTTKHIYYKKIGKFIFTTFYIDGTSDDVIATFTLPFTSALVPVASYAGIDVFDNGAAVAGLGIVRMLANEATAKCGLDGTAVGGFTNVNQKIVAGQFCYEAL